MCVKPSWELASMLYHYTPGAERMRKYVLCLCMSVSISMQESKERPWGDVGSGVHGWTVGSWTAWLPVCHLRGLSKWLPGCIAGIQGARQTFLLPHPGPIDWEPLSVSTSKQVQMPIDQVLSTPVGTPTDWPREHVAHVPSGTALARS